ncbi:hypothetical protein JCM3775_002358 [Rhodotorula graminis]
MHSTAHANHSAAHRLPPPSSSPSTTHRVASFAPHAAPSSDAHASLVASSKAAMLGTWDNPLIPVRRRRTTPAELNVLEREFGLNPRPDPLERARIAQRLGMTARAVQVWYQNRRQKQKKELACSSSSVASSGSDPRDLDGVLLSFSSSPLPSPAMPLHASAVASTPGELPKAVVLPSLQGPCTASPVPSSSASSSSGSNKENSYFPPMPTSAAAMPASSCGRVTAPALLAASTNAPAALAPSQQQHQVAQPYAYSYSATALRAAPTGVEAALSADASAHGVYLHRASTASIIAAKKHVRKRPQGSHAPLARVPSLPHAFVFPPSPVKPAAAATRLATVRKASLNDVADRQQKKAVEAAGLFAHAQGDTVTAAAQRRRSTTPVGGASATAPAPAPVAAAPSASTPFAADGLAPFAQAQPSSLVAMTPVSKAKAKDELLRHMESDPPSASSPAPLTRRRMMAHEASMGDVAMLGDDDDDDEHDDEDRGVFSRLDIPHRPTATRSLSASYTDSTTFPTLSSFPRAAPTMGRTASLGSFPSHPHSRTSTSASGPGPVEHGNAHSALTASSRAASAAAGSARTCAVEALGRKRARFIEHHAAVLPVRAPSSRPSTSAYATQGRAFGGLSFEFSTAAAARKEAGQRKRRRTSGESATSQASASVTSAATTAASTAAEDDSFGDLSFSSTSTASTVDSLVTVAGGDDGAYSSFAPSSSAKHASSSVEAHGGKTPEDEQRECAELLLGLGGFF